MSQVYDEKFIPVSDRAAEDEDERFAKLLAALKLVDRPGERSA